MRLAEAMYDLLEGELTEVVSPDKLLYNAAADIKRAAQQIQASEAMSPRLRTQAADKAKAALKSIEAMQKILKKHRYAYAAG